MSATLAFDIYGTLIDTHGVNVRLEEYIGDRAQQFSNAWREKQLEYSFRRGLMRCYQNFGVCTREALDYTDASLGTELSQQQKSTLLADYRSLPAFEDVPSSLYQLKAAGHKLYAFSNGTADAVSALLKAAGIIELFDGIISVDDKHTFKPNPDVYAYLLASTNTTASDTWLISSNSFDVIGATSYGLHSVWVQRSKHTVFDPWGIEPTIIIENLEQLPGQISNISGS
jgi:2-haloacid dehalogenase